MESKQPEQPKQTKQGKTRERGNGRGTLFKHTEGRYRWQYRNLEGKVLASGIAANKRDAEDALSETRTNYLRGTLATADRVSVSEYAKKWLESLKHLSPNTRRMYETDLGYANKIIGKMKLRDVRPTHLKKVLEELSNQVMKDGSGKTMSTRTLGMVRARIRAVFAEAVRDQIIYVNPADAVRRVKSAKNTEEFEGTALDFDQVARLQQLGEALYEAGRCVLYPAIFTAAALGLRRGEVMGLRWQDIDLKRGILSVCQNLTENNGVPFISTPKTKNSIRDIPIPPSLHAVLELHKTRQAEQVRKAGLIWQASSPAFATELGTLTHPANLRRALNGLIEWSNPEAIERKIEGKPNETRKITLKQRMRVIDRQYRPKLEAIIYSGKPLPQISPHDLRHTAGTLMLRRGMPVEVVSKILGHARVSITMDVYRHVLDSEKRAVMVDLFEYQLPKPVVNVAPLN